MGTGATPPTPVSWGLALIYGLPALSVGYMFMLVGMYAMKFATDVLLVAPAVMGMIFGVSRVWDAVTDPAVGHLSDKTRISFGRRRVWIGTGALPAALTFAMVFAVPQALGPTATIAWLTIAIVGFFTAMTAVMVPHLSWGAEFATDSTSRNKLFGARHGLQVVGSLVALVTLTYLISAERNGAEAAGRVAATSAVTAAIVFGGIILFSVAALSERPPPPETLPRGGLRTAAADIWANPHARLVFFVAFIEYIGSGAIGAMALYVAQYVMHAPEIAPLTLTGYLIAQVASVPLWVRVARHFAKHRLWWFSMIVTGLAFGAMFFLAFIESQTAQIVLNVASAIVAGIAAGCGGTIGPSVLSDIVDYDELATGERKEGAYFAAWNFAAKTAGGVTLILAGFGLSAIGFAPNQDQTQLVKVGMTALLGLLPLVCYAFGAALFSRFSLDEKEHAAIRRQLDGRMRRA